MQCGQVHIDWISAQYSGRAEYANLFFHKDWSQKFPLLVAIAMEPMRLQSPNNQIWEREDI